MNGDARAAALARRAVTEIAPDELALFDETAAAYFARPPGPSRAAGSHPVREPLGMGIEIVGELLTGVALAVSVEVLRQLSTDAGQALAERSTPRLRRLFRRNRGGDGERDGEGGRTGDPDGDHAGRGDGGREDDDAGRGDGGPEGGDAGRGGGGQERPAGTEEPAGPRPGAVVDTTEAPAGPQPAPDPSEGRVAGAAGAAGAAGVAGAAEGTGAAEATRLPGTVVPPGAAGLPGTVASPEAGLPGVGDGSLGRIREVAFQRARALGLEEERAGLLADAIVGGLVLPVTPER
ncbi:hypothetical protein [Streptomyces sp. NPDC058326]|uniref:hypothetical protein n=1 Tax=Streptomyces sp. NPDC058326 TaxID=3346447 RepID=UPI0036E0786A